MVILYLFGWVVFSCVLMSFIEHQVHSQLMHRRNFLSERNKNYKRIFEAHAITHHGHYSKIFSDDPVPPGEDKEIRLTVRKAPIKSLPVTLPLAIVSWQGALVFAVVMTLHHWIWNKVHLEMHKPERRLFSRWRIYQFLARYHYLHHRYPDKNFNVVFPLADFVFGTVAHAGIKDLEDMYRLGLFNKCPAGIASVKINADNRATELEAAQHSRR